MSAVFWLRNPNPYRVDCSSVKDAQNQPLKWQATGAPHSVKLVRAEVLKDLHLARLLDSNRVVPDPEFDAQRSGRPLAVVRAEYARAFGGGAPAPVAAPAVAPPAPPVVAVAPPVVAVAPPVVEEVVVEAPPLVEEVVAVEAPPVVEEVVEETVEFEDEAEVSAPTTDGTAALRKKKRRR